MQKLSRLVGVTDPKDIAVRSTRPGIFNDKLRVVFPKLCIPKIPRGHCYYRDRSVNNKVPRRVSDPIDKWLPNGLSLFLIEAPTDHVDVELVPRPETELFAPVTIEQTLLIKTHRLGN